MTATIATAITTNIITEVAEVGAEAEVEATGLGMKPQGAQAASTPREEVTILP